VLQNKTYKTFYRYSSKHYNYFRLSVKVKVVNILKMGKLTCFSILFFSSTSSAFVNKNSVDHVCSFETDSLEANSVLFSFELHNLIFKEN
jgi:hypothetical protein